MCVKNEENLNSCVFVTVQVRYLWLCIKVTYGHVAYILRLHMGLLLIYKGYIWACGLYIKVTYGYAAYILRLNMGMLFIY